MYISIVDFGIEKKKSGYINDDTCFSQTIPLLASIIAQLESYHTTCHAGGSKLSLLYTSVEPPKNRCDAFVEKTRVACFRKKTPSLHAGHHTNLYNKNQVRFFFHPRIFEHLTCESKLVSVFFFFWEIHFHLDLFPTQHPGEQRLGDDPF